MSRFAVCARFVRREELAASARFIRFHWCVESFARLTGEPFSQVFARLGARHGFGRDPGRFPDGQQMIAALDELEAEREAYLARLRQLAEARRSEKRAGRRTSTSPELAALEARRRAHSEQLGPPQGPWRYKRARKATGRSS